MEPRDLTQAELMRFEDLASDLLCSYEADDDYNTWEEQQVFLDNEGGDYDNDYDD